MNTDHDKEAYWREVQRILEDCTTSCHEHPADVVSTGFSGGFLLGNGAIGIGVGGNDRALTLYAGRNDTYNFSLGGVSITARGNNRGTDCSCRYRQKLATSEVWAEVDLDGVPTCLRVTVDAEEPLALCDLTNRGNRTVEYTVQTWSRPPQLSPNVPFLLRHLSWGRMLFLNGTDPLNLVTDRYDHNVVPIPAQRRSRYWIMRAGGDARSWQLENLASGRLLIDHPDGGTRFADDREEPASHWAIEPTYCGIRFRNVVTGRYLAFANHSVCCVQQPQRYATTWQIEYPDRLFDERTAGWQDDLNWAVRENIWRQSQTPLMVRSALVCRIFSAVPSHTRYNCLSFVLEPRQSAQIALAVEGAGFAESPQQSLGDLLNRGKQRVLRLNRQKIEDKRQATAKWWQRFWTSCWVDLHDPLLNRYWYGALHTLACACRPGCHEPGHWGPWIFCDNPNWNWGQTNNYNHQSIYYGCFSANHPELALPYIDNVLYHLPHGIAICHRAGYEGFTFGRIMGPRGMHGPQPDPGPKAPGKERAKLNNDQLDVGAFLAVPIINYWRYTRDITFLREKAYPFLRACMEFYADYLRFEDGRYVLYASNAREKDVPEDTNCCYALGLIRFLARACVEASEILAVDAENRETWRHILEHLSEFPTTWRNEARVFRESESSPAVSMLNDGVGDNAAGLQHIYPGECVGLASEKTMRDIALATLEHYNSDPQRPAWKQGNNFPMIFPVAARIGFDPERLLAAFRAVIAERLRPNATVWQSGGGIETCGSIETINSMLMQSHEGILRLFPVWPNNRDAKFINLRAAGGWLVSSEINKGNVSYIRIHALRAGLRTVANPWEHASIHDCRKHRQWSCSHGEITLNLAEGDRIHMEPGSP